MYTLIMASTLFATNTESSINRNGAAANGDVEAGGGVGGAGGGKTAKLSSGAWCVCRWLISCMKKDEPAVGATTFQNNIPNTPQVRVCHRGKLLLPPSSPVSLSEWALGKPRVSHFTFHLEGNGTGTAAL